MTKQEFLAMSLPYGIKVYDCVGNSIEVVDYSKGCPKCICKAIGQVKNENKCVNVFQAAYDKQIKPILHPLSDLTKDQDKEDSLFWRLEEFACNTRDAASMYDHSGLNDINWLQEPFEIVMWLIKEHVDILGLIKNKEAIDVNTLDHNPYI